MENVIIVGSGCAGLTAAIYAARANLQPIVLEGPQPGGQLTTTSEVENFPGFPEGIDGFMLMDNLRSQAKRFGTRFETDLVESIDVQKNGLKTIKTQSTQYETLTLIVATGAAPRLLGVPGEQEMYGGKGVTTCATCDGAFYRDMDVVVVGGGDSACEEALFLTRFCKSVTLIHRRDELRASKIMAERTLAHEKITVKWDSAIKEIIAGEDGNVTAVELVSTKEGEEDASTQLNCKGVFIAIGHIPNTKPFTPTLPIDGDGYFVPKAGTQIKTDTPGIYVAGDCADHVYRQAITAAGMGCQAAIEAERYLEDAKAAFEQNNDTAAVAAEAS